MRCLIKYNIYAMLLAVIFLSLPHTGEAKGTSNEFTQLNKIEQSITKSDWSSAQTHYTKLHQSYTKQLWKYQIFGNKNEYGNLQDELAKLDGAIKAKDKTQSLVILSYIRSLYKQIYSP